MTVATPIRAARQRAARRHPGEVLIGEDWVAPDTAPAPPRDRRARRRLFTLNRSPLARKIIVFNLLGLIVLVAGVLFLNPSRDSLVEQRERGITIEARLVADILARPLPGETLEARIGGLDLAPGTAIFDFAPDGTQMSAAVGKATAAPGPLDEGRARPTVITDLLNAVWDALSAVRSRPEGVDGPNDGAGLSRALFPAAAAGETVVRTGRDAEGNTLFAVATPIRQGEAIVGVVALTSATGEIDRLVRDEREQVLRMFVVALLVSIGLSLVLASTIANPLSDLAAAAERGRDRNARRMAPGRIRIPDLSARPDEIGRLSIALRGMVAALYDRIDANEQFAADVAHEIKNPLALCRRHAAQRKARRPEGEASRRDRA
jgi:two-component system sensor histidine kinase ChvG